MTRKRTEWKFRGGSLRLGERTLIMGILNVTPDSFSDGGAFLEPDEAVEHALEMQRAGADIIDIGAESTRPGSERISAAEELRRLVPVLKRLKNRLDIPICVDTYKPEVAEKAIEHGAVAINDVSGLIWEPDLARVVRDSGVGLVLNHTRGMPHEWAKLPPMRDVMGEIVTDLQAAISRAANGGVPADHLLIDPGIGFGKRKEQNSELLARLAELRKLIVPVLVGPSRKSFLAQDDPQATEYATGAAVSIAILNGAAMVRVHDVAAARAVVAVTDAVVEAAPEPVDERAARKSARQGVREREEEEAERRKPVRPEVGVVRIHDEEEAAKPAAAESSPEKREPLIPNLRPAAKKASGSRPERRDDRDDRPSRSYGPPRGREGGEDKPRRFGPPRDRDDRDDRPSRSYGPPRGRDGGEDKPRRFGPPRDRDDRGGAPRKFAGPPRGRDGGEDRPRRFGPPRDRDDRGGAPRKFAGPPRGREGGEDKPRRFGPPRNRDDRGGGPPRKSGPPGGGGDEGPRPRKFSGPPRGEGPGGGNKREGGPRKFGGPGGGKRGPSTPPRRKP